MWIPSVFDDFLVFPEAPTGPQAPEPSKILIFRNIILMSGPDGPGAVPGVGRHLCARLDSSEQAKTQKWTVFSDFLWISELSTGSYALTSSKFLIFRIVTPYWGLNAKV